MSDMKQYIAKVAAGETLDKDEATGAFDILMSGEATPSQIGGFLMALRVRGETVDEITGAAKTMRAKMLTVDAPTDAVDIVGTGGDNSGTYNISTCTAFVVAAAGIPVAKHGNRALSSKSGAADVLIALGVNVDADAALIARCIREAGVGFMFAPNHHAAMKHVGPTRVELGTRTIFNILGPLSNPAGTRRQLIGVFSPQWVEPIAEVMRELGAEKVWVVHGSDGLDEMTTTGPTRVAALDNGEISTFEVSPGDIGLATANAADLKGADAATNAEALRGVLTGKPGAYRDIVVLNAAGGLVVAGAAKDLKEGAALAAELIDSGKAAERLERHVAISQDRT
ncbi:MAG: anthranilate phosphoribosyltransferase [Flavobacteriaceae bacterium]